MALGRMKQDCCNFETSLVFVTNTSQCYRARPYLKKLKTINQDLLEQCSYDCLFKSFLNHQLCLSEVESSNSFLWELIKSLKMLRMLDLCSQKRYLNIRKISEMGGSGFIVGMFRIYNTWLLSLTTMNTSQDACSSCNAERTNTCFS